MDYVSLGRSGLKVSPLCLGTMMFGGRTDEADSRTIIGMARDAGLNFVDTADVYNEGRSEEIVGRAISGRPRRLGAGHQGLQPDGQGPERSRPVAPLADARLRGQPAPPRDGLDRRLLPPQGGPLDPARGDRLGTRRPDPPGQDPLLRPLQLPRLADRRGRQVVRAPGRRPPGRPPALLQPPQPHARGRAAARLRPLRPRRRALQPARPRHPVGQVRPRRAAPARHPRRCRGQADHGDRVAPREPGRSPSG